MKFLICFGCMIILAACTTTEQANQFADDFLNPQYLKPRYMREQLFFNTPTGQPLDGHIEEVDNDYGNDSYKQGFEDGCRSYSGLLGAGTMRLMRPQLDGERMSTDPLYLRGVQDASSFCTFSLDWETH